MFLWLQIQHMKPFHLYSWEGTRLCLMGAPISPTTSSSATRTQTMTLSQCSIVHITLSSYGLITLTFTGESCSNPGPHEKKNPSLLLYLWCQNLHGRLHYGSHWKSGTMPSQWKSSGFTSGKQLKDQTAFNTSGSWERAQEGPRFLLFLYF